MTEQEQSLIDTLEKVEKWLLAFVFDIPVYESYPAADLYTQVLKELQSHQPEHKEYTFQEIQDWYDQVI